MKIHDAQVQLISQYSATERYEKNESLLFWVGGGPSSRNGAPQNSPLFQIQDQITLSLSSNLKESVGYRQEDLLGTDVKSEIIRLLLEKLTGRRIEISSLSDLDLDRAPAGSKPGEQILSGQEGSAGFGLAYDRYEACRETQHLRFSSSGVLRTENGREIRFELQFEMEQTFSTSEDVSLRLGDARKIDPLVVDLNGQAAILTDATFSFDINSDGVEETLAALGPGKGFLAMDRNGDGRITDGGELFGPRSNSGFLELAGLDEDGDGWVDENESGFRSLGFWVKDPTGNETLLSVHEAGIGAIYTGKISAPFLLKDAGNTLRGELKEAGLYLKENGEAGLLQEIDMVI